MTPLDLSSLIPYLWGAWATGLLWIAIQLGRGAWRGSLSLRSARVTAIAGASHACALSVCAIATAAYFHRLISHGVEGLVITSLSAAMAGSVYACDRSGPELGISSGDTSSDSGS